MLNFGLSLNKNFYSTSKAYSEIIEAVLLAITTYFQRVLIH